MTFELSDTAAPWWVEIRRESTYLGVGYATAAMTVSALVAMPRWPSRHRSVAAGRLARSVHHRSSDAWPCSIDTSSRGGSGSRRTPVGADPAEQPGG